MSQHETTTDDIMDFLKENMVVKADFNAFTETTNKRLSKVEETLDSLHNHYVTKEYLDDKLSNLAAEIGARIERVLLRDKEFKIAIIEILRKNQVGSAQDIQKLEALIQ